MSARVAFPIEPALARGARELPVGPQWCYEQKFDGFRAIAFCDEQRTVLQSRGLKDLTRYFPELVFPRRDCVLDGEIVVQSTAGAESFDSLSQRIHPAATRIERLAREVPATYVAFDVLSLDGEDLLDRPFAERRLALEGLDGLRIAECVSEPQLAERWLEQAEGVVAKLRDAAYDPGGRRTMVKVKRLRTIDCVVLGYRPGKEPATVGSIILGLYEPDGELRTVGHSSGFTAAGRRELRTRLAVYETGERASGAPSRWSAERDGEWIALRPELVVECSYDHASDGRIRHGTRVLRWREDKPPRACTVDQLV